MRIWESHSSLTFIEKINDDNADIRLSFERQEHREIDHFIFNDITLGHAFQPGEGLGGDVHFRENVNWDFNVLYDQLPEEGKVSFFAVALHELGHSLGLGHSDDSTAVMYKYYSMNTATLSNDDIRGIHHIYGIPSKPSSPQTNEIYSSGESTISNGEILPATTPDKCNTSYDAIATIRGELFIFKEKYMWRPEISNEYNEIRQLWNELPQTLSHVDAVFENAEGQFLFFIGNQLYIFESTKLVSKLRLYHLGMDWNVKKIDAIFRWPYNQKIYIFSGDNYYRYDEKINRVERDYPQLIEGTFRDVYDIDTAFTSDKQLYFFKNEYFYEFDDNSMRMKRMKPQKSSIRFMRCIEPNLFATRTNFDDEIKDYITFDEIEIEDFQHHEKSLYTSSGIVLKGNWRNFISFLSILLIKKNY